MDRAHSALPGAAGDAAAWEAANKLQRIPLLPDEQRSCQQPITNFGRCVCVYAHLCACMHVRDASSLTSHAQFP
eukprot:502905-Pelagomonas_calceolata.AAC.2